MPLPTIRNFTPLDIPQVMALQRAYQRAYPHASVIPGELYLSAGFEDGRNIFCAFDDEEYLEGYAPIMPVFAKYPAGAHTVWAEVKTDPSLGPWPLVKNFLFQRVVQRARELIEPLPEHPAHLTFQYHSSEAASIDFVTSKGCKYAGSVVRMMRGLAFNLPEVAVPERVTVRRWRMETEAEQAAYVRARNEAFPDNPVALADWQGFLSSSAWCDGVAMTAFDGEEVVGSVAAFPDEMLSQHTGTRAAHTEYIFVRPAWRGRGIAAYLVVQALQYLKELGREAAYLEVRAENENALDLYRRLGYNVVDETRLYVLDL
jgi:ribosomal protein S18 acetylase RimI-like enzyme